MRPNVEITQYRVERWLHRFEELWDAVERTSLVRGRETRHLQSLPMRFSELFSLAVDRYLDCLDLMERDENWILAYLFSVRAYGCPHFTAEDVNDLSVSFPVGADFSEQKRLCAYVEKMFEAATSDRELMSAAERTVSLTRLWSVGMTPWLLGRIAPVCGLIVFRSINRILDPTPGTRHRTLATLIDCGIDVFDVGLSAMEEQLEIEDGRNVEVLQGELASNREVVEGLRGALLYVNTRERLLESEERSLDKTSWRTRLEESGLADIIDIELRLIAEADVGKLQPADDFLSLELERVQNDVNTIAAEIQRGEILPEFKTLQFLLRNLLEESDLRNTIFDEWIPLLSADDQNRINLWAGRTAVQAQLNEMSLVLGETISADGFELSDFSEIQKRSLELVAGRLRFSELLREPRMEESTRISSLFYRGKLREDGAYEKERPQG